MTRWLVTGAGGMLGTDLTALLRETGRPVTAAARADLDLADAGAVAEAVRGHGVVVNCAAWTAVDAAETAEDAALAINGTAVEGLARACAEAGAALIQISTDYVLPGDDPSPAREDAPTGPVNAYGRTKLAGERAALAVGGRVVRTAWLYGAHGPNFVATMARLAAERDTVDVVADQHGQPTWTADLAELLVRLGESAAPSGVYHGTNAGSTTWHGLASAVFEGLGLDPGRVRPTTSEAFPRPARRPAYSVLGHDAWTAAGLAPLRDWREALAEHLAKDVIPTR
ncbi:dTDP-4-dehydrorhamnose reductase [Actinocorallia sp. A-T 12471]|uniref:dTDP-4-dehydrorhamnose reductase n=1 Tax=Actinocorallia sp. A-T 12471 TaxID=3089813 RepID=UPI0029CECCC3|nr:dTDP-4-dehydrorhamnose reductase [Actinocorallia sp. A-T 12471]MDX6738518.1 dTDP-4-dehydrorhamnose reductase [Actinocorallia sp. A-T 12471]